MIASSSLLFSPDPAPVVPIANESRGYPVNRIFCVGRNYAEHAREMASMSTVRRHGILPSPRTRSSCPERQSPILRRQRTTTTKWSLVVAIGRPAFRASVPDAPQAVFGYACGLDMTRRDLQIAAREKSRPWDLGKAFEDSAIISALTPAARFPAIGPQRISLTVGGAVKQDAHLSDLIWSVPELVSHLSRYYHLRPGDLIYCGTPAGVGPVVPGDHLVGEIDGLQKVTLTIGNSE
jgi:fumarylpyruvate hydrolase